MQTNGTANIVEKQAWHALVEELSKSVMEDHARYEVTPPPDYLRAAHDLIQIWRKLSLLDQLEEAQETATALEEAVAIQYRWKRPKAGELQEARKLLHKATEKRNKPHKAMGAATSPKTFTCNTDGAPAITDGEQEGSDSPIS